MTYPQVVPPATPVPSNPKAAALLAIRNAAQHNTAEAPTALDASVYTTAGVTGVNTGAFLAGYNSALDSAAVNGWAVNTTEKLQTLVSAYNNIIMLSRGGSDFAVPLPTAAQYAAIGVTGMKADSNALHLLDDSIFGIGETKIDSVAEVQAMANAANHIMAAAGGTAKQAAALTVQDFSVLGITGVTAENLAQVQDIIRSVPKDIELSHRFEVQAQIDAHLGNNAEAAHMVLIDAASFNAATAANIGVDIYTKAGVHDVTSSNLASINSALNSAAVSGEQVLHISDLQGIVDAYNAIMHSADGVAGNTTVALTGAQYAKVGVTGISGTATDGSALHLLNDTLDGLRTTAVDTVPELQAVANAANHVMAAVGSNSAHVTLQDLRLLGITGATAANLSAIDAALHTTTAIAVDTHLELQNFANAHHAVILA